MKKESFLVYGAGSWGTALSAQLYAAGNEVFLTSFDKKNVQKIKKNRENKKYLPGVTLHKDIGVGVVEDASIERASAILVCVKSPGFMQAIEALGPKISNKKILWATKGFSLSDGSFFSSAIEGLFGGSIKTGVISGPTFAEELAAGKPTAMTIATKNIAEPGALATCLSGGSLRVYTSSDMIGVQFGGGYKNIIAIAAGISDGLGLGANARSALITRGLDEMNVLGVSLGADKKTFFGLSGLGDLVLSSTDNKSRNRMLGYHLGSGLTLDDSVVRINGVPEGVNAIKTLVKNSIVTKKHPISYSVYEVLYEGLAPANAAKQLMDRPIKKED